MPDRTAVAGQIWSGTGPFSVAHTGTGAWRSVTLDVHSADGSDNHYVSFVDVPVA